MALFCVTSRRDLVSLSRFPFFSHVQVLFHVISSVCHLKYPYSCFSSHFCLLDIVVVLIFKLSVIFLIAVIVFLLILLIRVFHISVNWWSFTGDGVTVSLYKSPGLFSVFWPFSIMLLFGWSPFGRQLPNLPGPLIIL